jgi:hypothetical protein
MTVLAGSIVIGVSVSSNLIGCERPTPANGRRCLPRRGGVGITREPTRVSAVLLYCDRGGGGEGRGFSYLLESRMTYLASSHVLRS